MGWGFDDDGPDSARTLREADNGIEQAQRLSEMIAVAVSGTSSFALAPEAICDLNRYAVAGLVATAGTLRQRSDVEIAGSKHVLPPHESVPSLLAEACAFVTDRPSADPVFLAAYILWRVCWIHPFDDLIYGQESRLPQDNTSRRGSFATPISSRPSCPRVACEIPPTPRSPEEHADAGRARLTARPGRRGPRAGREPGESGARD